MPAVHDDPKSSHVAMRRSILTPVQSKRHEESAQDSTKVEPVNPFNHPVVMSCVYHSTCPRLQIPFHITEQDPNVLARRRPFGP